MIKYVNGILLYSIFFKKLFTQVVSNHFFKTQYTHYHYPVSEDKRDKGRIFTTIIQIINL